MTPYVAPAWLPGGHAQTIWPVARKPAPPPYRRERWETPDGDFIDVDWLATPEEAGAPLVILFHGLEGSSSSHYAGALMRALAARGWGGAVPHFRGCSGEPNRLPRAYHSGDSAEIDWVLRRMRALFPQRRIFAAGVSLGGNALLKWAGEREQAARDVVQALAGVCAPLDLTAAGRALERGFSRVYAKNFLVTLKANSAAKLARHPGLFDAARMRSARTLYEFDDVVTAPVHGFRDADDYWLRASSKPWLGGIRLPALVLNALNDPFLPRAALPAAQEVAATVTLDYPAGGGHVGFVAGAFPGRLDWLPQRLLSFFDRAG
ncbi:MAG: hydrolase [Betaproteobacteria bacterium]|nr:hydrolase [Betaproteobacteria bacterium]